MGREIKSAMLVPKTRLFLVIVEEKVICWICRGASKEFAYEMREIIREHKPKIIILIEPRISGEFADRVCRRLGKKTWIRVEAVGFSGGIWVMWEEDEICVKLEAAHRSFLHMEVRSANGSDGHLRRSMLAPVEHSTISLGKA